ncbi:TPA: conjugal transfer protein TrbH [Escherichia coli]|nr:conjugal transfer protein TrbH [Salmonella enterica]EKD5436163.1 conjugal transfer protein TrbH [Salmonella enterica subsp. enterica serovar Montevideo]EKG8784189.1 conjugal transfer protein TrbH [Salmonella enterica]
MLKIRVLLPVVLALLVSACASTRPTMSFVASEVTASDATVLAKDTATYLADPLPPAKTTVVLDPPANKSADVMTPALIDALRAAGYGVVEADRQNGPKAGEGTPVRYLVSPLENGVLLRLQYLGTEASRFYPRTASGALVSAGPFTVRGAAQ